MNKKIIAVLTATAFSLAVLSACTDKETSESEAETEAVTTEAVAEETEAEETESEIAETEVAETEASEETTAETEEDSGIPGPGDIYNGHTVDHTEDQPNCDDGSHGTIFIFYTDSEDIDYIEY